MNAVLFADEDMLFVDSDLLQKLRDMAQAAPLKRARLCLHRQSSDPIQEMVIAFAGDSYVRPHRHHGKSESYHLLEGLVQVILFDDERRILRRVELGPPGSGRPSLFRMSNDVWHTVLVESDSVIMHETTNGPFVPNQSEFATWAPDGSDAAEAEALMDQLRTAPIGSLVGTASSNSASANSASANETTNPEIADARSSSPTLTAIICNFNHGRFVVRAIEAMLAQSRRADELIVVDDGSTDDSVNVIRSIMARNPDIRFLQNERNQGFHASLQRALDAATGDYVYSGAADDRVLPGFFAGVMQMAQQYPAAGLISGQFISVDPTGRRLATHQLSKVHNASYLSPRQYLSDILKTEPATHSLSCATVFKRKALQDVGGFSPELGSWGDTFAIQAIGLRDGVCYWPQPAMEWTVLPGSMSHSTRSNPAKKLQIVDRAAKRMRSAAFRSLFPEDYVQHWVQGFRQAIAHEQLEPVIDANQTVQSGIRAIADDAKQPTRGLLELLRFAMRGLYFVTFRVMRRVVTQQLETLSKEPPANEATLK